MRKRERLEHWGCKAAEIVQLCYEEGIKVIPIQGCNKGFHFISKKPITNARLIYLAKSIGVQWWREDWEERVLK